MNQRELKWVRKFIASCDWTFSKTMPQWPHWYIVREDMSSPRAFDQFIDIIEAYATRDDWGKQERYYLKIDNYKYWAFTRVINRSAPIPSAEVRRLGDLWLRKNRKRVGPYGNLVNV